MVSKLFEKERFDEKCYFAIANLDWNRCFNFVALGGKKG